MGGGWGDEGKEERDVRCCERMDREMEVSVNGWVRIVWRRNIWFVVAVCGDSFRSFAFISKMRFNTIN